MSPENIRFIVEVVLISGVGGIGFKVWDALAGLRKESFEQRKQLFEEQNTLFQQQFEQQKQREAVLEGRLNRLSAELKPVTETQAKIAFEIASQYYLPVLSAAACVDLYVDYYLTANKLIKAAEKYKDTHKIPDCPPNIRDALEKYSDTNKLLEDTKGAWQNCADILFAQLETLYRAVEKLIGSGYVWELESRKITRDDIIHFFNWYNSSRIPALAKRRSPDELLAFLEEDEWKSNELEPVLRLKRDVPWEKFMSDYYRKLHNAISPEKLRPTS